MENTKRSALQFLDREWKGWPCAGRGFLSEMLVAYAKKVTEDDRKSAPARKRPKSLDKL